jgi:hypothetical protein
MPPPRLGQGHRVGSIVEDWARRGVLPSVKVGPPQALGPPARQDTSASGGSTGGAGPAGARVGS